MCFKQLLPIHPLTHVQVLEAKHSMLMPHWELQIATYSFCKIIIYIMHTSITNITYVDSLV